MTDTIVRITQEGRNGTIVRLWTSAGNQVDLRPTDPDTAFQALYAVQLIGELFAQTVKE